MKNVLEILKSLRLNLELRKINIETAFISEAEYALDEAIAELEEAIDPKRCDTCKWEEYCGTNEDCLSSKYITDRYEKRE